MLLHVTGMVGECFGEGLQRLETGELREIGQCFLVCGQALGLLIGDHLDAVLDGAQEAVGARQFAARFLADPSCPYAAG